MSFFSLLLLFILFYITSFIAYRFYIYIKGVPIKVFYNKNSNIVELVQSVQCFKKPYHPTPWLFNRHAQTLYAMQLRKLKNFSNEREKVTFPDGGNAIIDWFHPTIIATANDGHSTYDKKEDFIIIFHTLGGGSREKVINSFGVACANKGYTAAVLNCRGCAGAKFTSEKAYNAYEIDDFKYSIENHVKKRNPRHIFICGFSMGAIHASRYACDYPSDVTAIVAVSHPMDSVKSAKILETFPINKLYLPNIMESHHRLYRKHPFIKNPEIEKTKNMTELDTIYTAPTLGMKSCTDYWEHICVYDRIEQFNAPIMQLVAEDDPITTKACFPYKEAQEDGNRYMALVTTKEGGHCGFIEGIDGEHSLVEDLAFEWFERAVELNIKNSEMV